MVSSEEYLNYEAWCIKFRCPLEVIEMIYREDEEGPSKEV
jgi:hypothetical protein